MRKARGRADAATFHHVAVADQFAPRAVAAFEELLAQLRPAFTGRHAAALVGVASPEYVAGQIAPEVVAKRITESTMADLFADIATEAGTTRPGFATSFSLVRDESVAFARQQAADLVQGIDQQTKGLISDVISRGQLGDLTWNQMAAEIRPLIGLSQRDATAAMNYRAALKAKAAKVPEGPRVKAPPDTDKMFHAYVDRLVKQRAVTIARTETIRAASAGELISWQATIDSGGADGYTITREWSVTRDDRACPRCVKLDGEKRTTAPVGEGSRPTLANDGGFEGVPHPPLHPRCRCVILTTMELAPLPDRPAPAKPESWTDAARKQQAAVGRAAKKAAAFGPDPSKESLAAATRMEGAVRKLGRQVDDEIRRRLVADGVTIVDASEYRKAKAAYEKATAALDKRYEVLKKDGYVGLAERMDKDAQYRKLKQVKAMRMADFTLARINAQDFRRLHAARVPEVLAELRQMGGKIDLGAVYKGKPAAIRGVDVAGGIETAAKRYPKTWVDRSNAVGPVNVIYEKNRAYYLHSKSSVALTPEQIADPSGNSTVTHEFMHRMEWSNPDVMRAEWAFLNRRAKGEPLSQLSKLTGNSAYGSHEVAVGDEFSNPYMGKVYRNVPDHPYEVMSMGVEGLYWHDRPSLDTDYTAFVLGVLAGL